MPQTEQGRLPAILNGALSSSQDQPAAPIPQPHTGMLLASKGYAQHGDVPEASLASDGYAGEQAAMRQQAVQRAAGGGRVALEAEDCGLVLETLS